uniref:Uncharacterized protein n=1 Tax=Bubo bubo TaxID=30461 RepID=A0A8C0EGK7_BUBBB
MLATLHLILVLPCAFSVSVTWLGGRLRFTHFDGTMLLSHVFFLSSCLRWEMELRQAGHGPYPLSQPAHTPLWLIVLGAQGAWYHGQDLLPGDTDLEQ